MIVLVNGCDKYSYLWDGWFKYFKNFEPDYPVYFLSDEKDVKFNGITNIKVNIPEIELWTKKLRLALEQLPDDDIFLLLDDLYFVKKFTQKEFDNIYRTFKTINADSLRIRENKSKYTTLHPTPFKANGVPLMKLDSHSKYLISYNPGIWKREFLLECIKKDENTWVNETRGSQRLEGKDYGIYSYRKDGFFVNTCRKGKLTPEGEKLLKAI